MSDFHDHRPLMRAARDLSHVAVDANAARAAVDAARRRLADACRPPSPWRLPRLLACVAAIASLCLLAAVFAWVTAGLPREAFAQVVQRVERFDCVRYTDRSQGTNSRPLTDRITCASGGRYRSELSAPGEPVDIHIHNLQTSPEADLVLHPKSRSAEFRLPFPTRGSSATGSPIDQLKQFATEGMVPAPDEVYHGRPVRVYVSAKPEVGLSQSMTRRVLVDRDTGLPVRIQIDYDMTRQGQGTRRLVREDFEWNPAIDPDTFSTRIPDGYKVTYDLIKPLSEALGAYAANSPDHRLPDRLGPEAFDALKRQAGPQGIPNPSLVDMTRGFSVPAFAAKHGLDVRYYGAGKTFDTRAPGTLVAAAELAPGSGKYEALLTDFSRRWMNRSELP